MDIVKELKKLRRSHYYCEDSWYSCPKAEDGCSDDREGDECNCSANRYNEILDKIIGHIENNG